MESSCVCFQLSPSNWNFNPPHTTTPDIRLLINLFAYSTELESSISQPPQVPYHSRSVNNHPGRPTDTRSCQYDLLGWVTSQGLERREWAISRWYCVVYRLPRLRYLVPKPPWAHLEENLISERSEEVFVDNWRESVFILLRDARSNAPVSSVVSDGQKRC